MARARYRLRAPTRWGRARRASQTRLRFPCRPRMSWRRRRRRRCWRRYLSWSVPYGCFLLRLSANYYGVAAARGASARENAGNGRSAQPFGAVASQVSRLFAMSRAHGFCARVLPAVLCFAMQAVPGYCKKVYSLRFEGRSLALICACLLTPRPSEAPRTLAAGASCLCGRGF